MIRKEREIKVIYVLVLAIFAVFLAIPIVRLLLESFLGEAGAGISNYVEVLTGRGFLQALGNSVAVSISSALIATILAFFMAYSIQYTNLPGKFKAIIRTLADYYPPASGNSGGLYGTVLLLLFYRLRYSCLCRGRIRGGGYGPL